MRWIRFVHFMENLADGVTALGWRRGWRFARRMDKIIKKQIGGTNEQ